MEEVLNKFVNYFFEGADDSVKDYVKGTLHDFLHEDANEEGSSDIISDVADFLPPGQDPSTLPAAIQQLKSAVNGKEENAAFIWLQSPQLPTIETEAKPQISSSSFKFSDLKATATEFKFNPTTTATTAATVTGSHDDDAATQGLTEDLTNLNLDTQKNTYNTFYNDGQEEGGAQEEGDAYTYDKYQQYNDSYFSKNDGFSNYYQQQQPPSLALQGQSLDTAPLDRDAILAVLLENFPAYSPTALEEMFVSCGNSLPTTVDMLYRLENELYYSVQQQQLWQQQQQGRNSNTSSSKDTEVEFSADDFPSLGGGKGKEEGERKTSSIAFGANYAGKAKAAAHLPALRPQKPTTTTNNGSFEYSNHGGSRTAAPVWQAQGIEKFTTGVSVAADYAEARSEARDHARARNVCFEGATQAYISGNKALAKELGAKGRWHNEKMKAAHARAAEETFSKRNAMTLGTTNTTTFLGSSNSASGSGSAPPTIDLHGLHVSEALHHLDQAIENLQQRRVSKVRLVVGVGQHGKVPARLKTAVERHLVEAWGLRYREPYEGLLEVTLLT